MKQPKKIGIDAKWYYDGPPSGKVVIRNIINEILKINQDRCDFFLFIYKKHEIKAKKEFKNRAEIVTLSALPNFLSNVFSIPFFSQRHDLDVVFFENFASPLPMKAKKIVHIHDLLFLDFPHFFSKKELIYFKLMPFLARYAKKIITTSFSEKERLIRHKILSREDITVVYSAAEKDYKPLSQYSDEKIESFNKKYQLPMRFVLYVGRINVRKNILNLVNAMDLLNDKNIKLLIVGGGKKSKDIISSTIDSLHLTDRVIFTGQVNDEDIYLMYARASVFCFPSYAEGFGIPPLEAMRCGIPVVVSNRTSLPEVCGDAGIYINPDKPDEIANSINELLSNPLYYQEKSLECLEHEKKFSWEIAASQILKTIESVC